MADEETARVIVYETDGWFMALCPDYPGITGDGPTRDACVADLTAKIEQSRGMVEDQGEDQRAG